MGVCGACRSTETPSKCRRFYVLRLLLGLMEAGTFPGLWWLLTQFYTTPEVRCRPDSQTRNPGLQLDHLLPRAGLLCVKPGLLVWVSVTQISLSCFQSCQLTGYGMRVQDVLGCDKSAHPWCDAAPLQVAVAYAICQAGSVISQVHT